MTSSSIASGDVIVIVDSCVLRLHVVNDSLEKCSLWLLLFANSLVFFDGFCYSWGDFSWMFPPSPVRPRFVLRCGGSGGRRECGRRSAFFERLPRRQLPPSVLPGDWRRLNPEFEPSVEATQPRIRAIRWGGSTQNSSHPLRLLNPEFEPSVEATQPRIRAPF